MKRQMAHECSEPPRDGFDAEAPWKFWEAALSRFKAHVEGEDAGPGQQLAALESPPLAGTEDNNY